MKNKVLAFTALICMTTLSAVAENNSSHAKPSEDSGVVQTAADNWKKQDKQAVEPAQRFKEEKKKKNGYSEKQRQPKYDPLETTLDLYN